MLTTKIGGYELDEHLFMDEKMSFFDIERKSGILLRGGGGKVHVHGPFYNEMQQFGKLTYPSPDNSASAETQIGTMHCYHFYGAGKWSDFREELRYIKKTGILVNRYDNDTDANWSKDIEFEGYFLVHQTRRAFIQLRYIKNNAAEPKTVKLIFFINLKIGGDEANDQGVWDSSRKAFRCWDAVNPKASYLLIGSPTTPTKRTINEDSAVWSQCWDGNVIDNDSYGSGAAAVGVQFEITLTPGASTVLPFYIVVGDSQIDVESEWDTLIADNYTELLSDTKTAWENWVDEGIVAEFEDNPWLTEAWIRNIINAYEMTWSNGGMSAGGPAYTVCFVWDSHFAIRTLLQAGHINEVRRYLQFLRTCVASDPFNPYPSSAYNYAYQGGASPGGPDLVHACYVPVVLVWELYQKTKASTDLSDNWAMVEKYLDYVKDNFYHSTYHLITGLGLLDHPYRYHSGWAEGKYYASFSIAYQKAFEAGAEIADLLGYATEKATYSQIASELQTAIDAYFSVEGIYKSVWHPTEYSTAEGWDIELSCMYGRIGYNSDAQKKTFKEWQKWLKDYFPAHYDEVNYSAGQDWLYGYALADLLHSLILYGDYANFMMLYSRFKYVANYPKIQTAERVKQYEPNIGLGQTVFAWSHAISGALARFFDWTKDADGNYAFSLSSAPEVGKFRAVFPDGTSVTVSGEGNGSRAHVTMKPYEKDYTWSSERRKLNVTLKPNEDLEFYVATGGHFGLAQRATFSRKADMFGEKVEVQRKTLTGYDEFGNAVYGHLTLSIENAIIKPLKSNEDVIEAGLLTLGDAVGHFKAWSVLTKNYRIKTADAIYEAVSVEKEKNQGVTVCVKANLRRIVQ